MTSEKKLGLGQRLFAHSGIYASAQFAQQGIGVVLLPIYAHLLTREEFGTISLLGMMIPFVALVFTQGLGSAWFRLRQAEETAEGLRRFEATVIWYLLASIAVGIVLVSVFGNTVARLATPGISYYPLVFLTVVVAGMTAFSTLYLQKEQADQRPIRYAVYSFLKTATGLGAIILFVAGFRLGVLGKVIADAIVATAFACVSLALIRPGRPALFSTKVLRRCLAYALPLVPHSLIANINALAGRFLIAQYLGLAATGIYSMGWQVAHIGQIFAGAMTQAYVPMFIREVIDSRKLGDQGEAAAAQKKLSDLANVALLMVTATVCLALLLTGLAREALLVLATPAYSESWRVTALVAGSAVAQAQYFAFVQPLYFSMRGVRFAPLVSGSGMLVNIGANVILLPRIGFIGSAWALLAANLVMAAVAFALGRHYVSVPYRFGRWLGVFAAACLGLCSLYFLDDNIDSLLLRVVLKAVVVAGAALLAMRCTRVSVGDIVNFASKIADRARRETHAKSPPDSDLD